jgi:uncharacterized protein with ParB-like and HNH nuclease domain
MEVKAENLRIENVLTKGQYFIPDYQREYDWSEDELSEFIEDILEIGDEERYFIGHMVFEGDFNGTKFNVIDGQQTITTITILLCLIRDLFYEKKEELLANATNDKFIFNKDKYGVEFGILINQMPYPILQAQIQSKPVLRDFSKKPVKTGEFRILEAYDKFKSLFKDYTSDELKILREKLFNLEIIFVAVKESDSDDKVDAHEIFMTLNATGKDLTPLDLIKGRIFKLYPQSPILNEPADKWKEIIENTKGRKADRKNPARRSLKFLNNFFSYRFGKVSDKRIYKKFVREVIKPKSEKEKSDKQKIDIKTFLDDLHRDSIIFRKVTDPSASDWSKDSFQIFLSLEAITQTFGIEVANPILISLIKEFEAKNISYNYLIKALNIIERYHFINNAVVSGRSSGLDHKYSKYARDLLNSISKQDKHIVIDQFIDSLLQSLPEKKQFEASFDNKLFYLSSKTNQKRLVQYALQKLEFKANPNSDLIGISIEHLFPEKPKLGETKLDDEFIGSIGNLVLLDKTLNSDAKIGNNNYLVKKPIILNKSNIITTKNVFMANSNWGEVEIIERRMELIEELYSKVWQ